METIQFKYSSGGSAVTFNAVYVRPDFMEDSEEFDDVNYTKRKTQNAKWQVWDIRFGLLSITQQDWLNELKVQTAPQMIYESTTYDIQILEKQIRQIGASMKCVKTTKET